MLLDVSDHDSPGTLFPCPVCDTPSFGELECNEICNVCGWEDDPVQRADPEFAGGANKLSLNDARAAWTPTVRPPWSPPGARSPTEIAAIMDLRAKRAIDHVTGLAWGKTPRSCPICGYEGMFSPVRHKPEIWCPSCDSRPRHRLLKLWMDREMALAEGAKVLHFAAESWVRGWFEGRGAAYVTADINNLFELQLDITAMDLQDASYDLVMVNHVLEHVSDKAALAEMFRILRPGGQAVITVPMIEGWDETHEDPALVTEEALRLHYGDPTHLRFYGRDVRDRIIAAGFDLAEYVAVEPDVSTHALHRGERIFIGRKPGVEGATNG